MQARTLRCLVAAAALAATLPAGSEMLPQPCALPEASADPLLERESLLAAYERMPQSCLRAIFAACSQAASRTLLDFGDAAVCSFGYEALLKQGFGGNFRALLAWWQSQRGQAAH